MNFSKYNACGSDFIVIEFFSNGERGNLAKALCNRSEGIGANGLIAIITQDRSNRPIGHTSNENSSFYVEYYNADGTRTPITVNATMVACMYAYEKFLAGKSVIFKNEGQTINGEIAGFDVGRSVWIGQKKRDFSFGKIFGMGSNRAITANVEVEIQNVNRMGEGFVSGGNMWYMYETGMPNLVTFVNSLGAYNHKLAQELAEKFNANVSFAQIDGNNLKVRTYAFGAKKEVLSCGSGIACAYVAGRAHMGLGEDVNTTCITGEKMGVRMPSDDLAYVKGDVRHLFDGEYMA